MKNTNLYFSFLLLFLLFLTSCNTSETSFSINSPDRNISIEFALSEEGEPMYLIKHKSNIVIDTSFMSFDFKEVTSLKNNFKIVSSSMATIDETWQMPWGEQIDVKNNYNELIVNLEEKTDEDTSEETE